MKSRVQTMSSVVVYHKDCMDGFGAALVAWKKFGAQASYIPVSYGTEQDSFVDDMAKSAEHPLSELYVLDFSFNTAQVRRLAKLFRKITILDHHDTARNELMEERKIDEHCLFHELIADFEEAAVGERQARALEEVGLVSS